MIASASLAFNQLKVRCGYTQDENCQIHELISEGLRSAENVDVLGNMFQWLSRALFYGHMTPLTLVIGAAIRDMNLINDRRLIRDIGDEDVKEILQAMGTEIKNLNSCACKIRVCFLEVIPPMRFFNYFNPEQSKYSETYRRQMTLSTLRSNKCLVLRSLWLFSLSIQQPKRL